MNYFLWTVIVLLTLRAAGKLSWLSKGVFPPRETWQEAIDVMVNGVLVGWALWLL